MFFKISRATKISLRGEQSSLVRDWSEIMGRGGGGGGGTNGRVWGGGGM